MNLNDSIIYSVRDLGTAFRGIQILNIARCELKDLGGIVAIDNLLELYASYNEIDDLYDMRYLEKLEVLDLEANQIKDFSQINMLAENTELRHVTLEWNPISFERNFRKRVA